MLLLAATMLQMVRAETVTVYTNASFAPLVIDARTGLYPETVAYLNRLKIEGLDFKLNTMPTKRLRLLLDSGQLDGIVIGMTPEWFDDAAQRKYLWTQPFFRDAFVLVSKSIQPIFTGQLTPGRVLKIGVTRGYVYPGIDEWIDQHKMLWDEALTEEGNLHKLMRDRIDAVVVSESVLRFYVKGKQFPDGLIVEGLPGRPTERRMLIPRSKQYVFDKLAPVFEQLQSDPAWQALVGRF